MQIIYRQIGRDPLYKTWHTMHEPMLYYVHRGTGSIVFRDAILPIEEGTLCFVGEGKMLFTMPDDPDRYRRTKLFLTGDEWQALLNAIPAQSEFGRLFRENGVIYARIPPEARANAEAIMQHAAAFLSDTPCPASFLSDYLQMTLLLRQYRTAHIVSRGGVIEQAIVYIHTHYAEPLTLEDICGQVHISKYHFCRQFKQAVGMPVMEYLLETRIRAAKEYLATDGKTVSEIARACGFSGDSYFSQAFRRQVGASPRDWRKASSAPKPEKS